MVLTLDDVEILVHSDRRKPEPFVLVVFGASGDLTHRKLAPALFGLHCEGLLPDKARIIGFARSELTDESFREGLRDSIASDCEGGELDDEQWEPFARRLSYHRGQYDSAEDYESLAERIGRISEELDCPANCLFYLSTPPDAFVPIVRRLHDASLARRGRREAPWSRIIIEKPFGRDVDSARRLNAALREVFEERQIFRIDHYLGKEAVQNLMVLRFANSVFEPIWQQKYVDHVQITVAETVGVAGRGGYFDGAGIIRDMVQNHIMHLLTLVAMDPPASLAPDAIRDEKRKVLQALRPIRPDCAANAVIRAQYAAGEVDGEQVCGYRDEPDVPDDSRTETFTAFKAFVDNWRWAGVPFYLRTGKRLAERRTEVSVHFRPVPNVLFNRPPTGPLAANVLAVRVQPDEGIQMEFQVKAPGMTMRIRRLKMDFGYRESFGTEPPDAYQRLLLDAALGDPTLFTRADEVEEAWKYVCPIVADCGLRADAPLLTYPAGSWGPQAADELIGSDGNRWHLR